MINNKVLDTILKRQTIREYKPVQISEEELEALLMSAKRAPSGRNSQPCHVRFLQNAEILHQMHLDFKDTVGWDTPVHTRSEKNPFYHNAPTFAFIFAEGNSHMDAGLMTENICITAESLGLGTCIVASVGALFTSGYADKYKELLDIPQSYKFLIGICVGYPDEKPEMKPRYDDRYKVIR